MYGKEGRQSLGGGVNGPLRLDATGAMVTGAYGAKYMEAVLRGKVFVAANQAAVALTAAFATAYTGLVVENPAGSGKNLIMIGFSYASTVAIPTATALGLMTGADAGDAAAAITPRNRLMGGAASIAIVDNGCTLVGTPVLEQPIATAWTEATTAGTLGQPNMVDLNGSLIVTPGYYVAVYSAAANTAAFLFSFMWIEEDQES